jgi:hypothetical protein
MRFPNRLASISACVGAVIVIFLLSYHPTILRTLYRPLQLTPAESPPPRRLHVLLPINENLARRSPNFCKTLVSAMVHGYKPTIINWDVEGDGSFMQKAKVTGIVLFSVGIAVSQNISNDQECTNT